VSNNSEAPGCFIAAGIISLLCGSALLAFACFVFALFCRRMTTWCATGHRPEKLGGYSDEARHRLEQFAVTYLRYYAPDLFISGMAQGWDQACAYACTVLSIPWTAAIPFAGQESMWPDAAQKRLYAAT
jgi:hypothetical protein